MQPAIFARQALLPQGWHSNVRVELTGHLITSLTASASPRAGDVQVDTLVPGMPNLHSHAFQRGMAGLAERRGATADSFWTWRDVMYRFALSITPEEAEAIAAMAYVEMLESGFTRVGEFHYLHHAPGGPYADRAEMSRRILAAAEVTGINLTHLPVFYAHADFGGQPSHDGQRRFIHGLEDFARLVDDCRAALRRPLDRLGIAPHSLRAVTPDELTALVKNFATGPIHIHVAEQTREVEACLAHTGLRPVQWLLSNQPVDTRWCLIHATHITPAEQQGIAAAQAVAGLCPVTEANLGDGLCPAAAHLQSQGILGIGTDSNVQIAAARELQMLEYGQRLFHRARNVLAQDEGSTGVNLWQQALRGGAQALDAPAAHLAAGHPADMLALQDADDLACDGDTALDRFIFASGVDVAHVWAAGQHVVRDGAHIARQAVEPRFRNAMRRLLQV